MTAGIGGSRYEPMGTKIEKHWKKEATEPSQANRYQKYSEKIPSKMTKVVLLSIFSLGIYYLFLKCTKDGRETLANLKERTIIHYVPIAKSGTDKTPSGQGDQGSKKTTSKSQASGLSILGNNNEKKSEVENVIKETFKEYYLLSKTANDLKEIIQQDKVGVLVQELRSKDKELLSTIESFLLNKNNQTTHTFLEYVSKYFASPETMKLLKTTVESVKTSPPREKTDAEIAHKRVREAIHSLEDSSKVLDLIYHIKDDEDTKVGVHDLVLVLGNYGFFSGGFVDLYEKDPERFSKLVKTIEDASRGKFEEAPNDFKSSFEGFVKQCQDLRENLTTPRFATDYALKDYIQFKQLPICNQVKSFLDATEFMKSNLRFGSLFLSDQSAVDYIDRSLKLLDLDLVKKALLDQAAEDKKAQEAKEKFLNDPETNKNFQHLKKLKEYYSDLLVIVDDASPLLKYRCPHLLDDKFLELCHKMNTMGYLFQQNLPSQYFAEKFNNINSRYIADFERTLVSLNALKKQ